MTDRSFMSVTEASELLGITRRTAYHWVKQNKIPTTRIGGTIRIPRGAFNAWIAELERRALDSVNYQATTPEDARIELDNERRRS